MLLRCPWKLLVFVMLLMIWKTVCGKQKWDERLLVESYNYTTITQTSGSKVQQTATPAPPFFNVGHHSVSHFCSPFDAPAAHLQRNAPTLKLQGGAGVAPAFRSHACSSICLRAPRVPFLLPADECHQRHILHFFSDVRPALSSVIIRHGHVGTHACKPDSYAFVP